MSILLLPGIVSQPTFKVLSLFASGEQGVWYEPKPAYLYQDAAGTTPVTSDGDPVGLMLDRSGNNNHATQETSAARPIYRTDGTLHWLEFDGVDDGLATAPLPRIATDTDGISLSAAWLQTGLDAWRLSQYSAADNERVFSTNSFGSLGRPDYNLLVQNSGNFSSSVNLQITPPSEAHVLSARWRGAGFSNEGRINSQSWTAAGALTTSGDESIIRPLEIGTTDGHQPAAGSFFGTIVVGQAQSDSAHSDMDEYLANLAGVSL